MWNEQLVFSLDGGGTVTVTNANIWQGGLTIEQSVSSDGFFEIGSTHVGQMTVTLVDTFDDIDFQNATVVVSMAKDSDTLQQMGIYTVVRSERDNGILGITAYDNMHLLSEPYTTSLTFPSTYGAMANEICGTTVQFNGSTTAVQSAPEFEAETTKREVLGYIAQACGYNVMCNANGNVEFVRYNMSGFNTQGAYHEISSLFDFHHSYYPVVITGAKVIVRTTVTTTDPDTGETTAEEVVSEYTSGTDDYQIVIENNPLITTANGQLVANTIFATFGGVEFYTGSVSHLSDLSIKASDIMKVTDRTGTTYPMLVSSTQISTGSPQLSQSFAEEPASKLSVQPSLLDRVQTSVRQALLDAKNAQNKGDYVETVANEGKAIAEATSQHFWSDTNGAHVTMTPKASDPTGATGFNALWNALGFLLRNNANILAQFGQNSVAFYDGNGNLASDVIATFGASGIVLGKSNTGHIQITPTSLELYEPIGTHCIALKVQYNNSFAYSLEVWDGSEILADIYLDPTEEVTKADVYGDMTVRKISSDVQPYFPTWETGHAPADYHCVVSAGICSFSYRGPTIAHSDSTQIGLLPVGARPTSAVYCPFVKMGGGAVGCIRIQTTGVITVLLITGTSSTGRLYFNCTFPVA